MSRERERDWGEFSIIRRIIKYKLHHCLTWYKSNVRSLRPLSLLCLTQIILRKWSAISLFPSLLLMSVWCCIYCSFFLLLISFLLPPPSIPLPHQISATASSPPQDDLLFFTRLGITLGFPFILRLRLTMLTVVWPVNFLAFREQ